MKSVPMSEGGHEAEDNDLMNVVSSGRRYEDSIFLRAMFHS